MPTFEDWGLLLLYSRHCLSRTASRSPSGPQPSDQNQLSIEIRVTARSYEGNIVSSHGAE